PTTDDRRIGELENWRIDPQLPTPNSMPTVQPDQPLLVEGHTNLPAQSTALIGRDQDMVAARDLLLRSEVRLVTLTGPAGVGKTRLAIEIAAKLLDHSPDVVLFFDLSVISDPELVLTEITQTLGIREQGGQTQPEALDEY